MSLALSKKPLKPFTEHVRENLDALKSYCRSLAQSQWDAEDLVQETLLKAYQSWKRQPREMSKAYFIRIASNTWIDQYRKKTIAIENNQDVHELSAPTASVNAEEVHHLVQNVLKTLSPNQRTVVLLTQGFGMTAKEAADILGISEGAVKAALHRGRKKLKNLSKVFDETDDDEWRPYIDALAAGNPERIVHLYREETGNVSMKGQSHGMAVQGIMNAGDTSYVLLRIVMKNGKPIILPFYHKEWGVLLSLLMEGGVSQTLIA